MNSEVIKQEQLNDMMQMCFYLSKNIRHIKAKKEDGDTQEDHEILEHEYNKLKKIIFDHIKNETENSGFVEIKNNVHNLKLYTREFYERKSKKNRCPIPNKLIESIKYWGWHSPGYIDPYKSLEDFLDKMLEESKKIYTSLQIDNLLKRLINFRSKKEECTEERESTKKIVFEYIDDHLKGWGKDEFVKILGNKLYRRGYNEYKWDISNDTTRNNGGRREYLYFDSLDEFFDRFF